MKKKAILLSNFIYIMLAVVCVVFLSAFIWSQSRGAALWSDYYVKELTRIVNKAEAGQEVILDIHKATEIAYGNGVTNFETIFQFNNRENEVCVKLSPMVKNCYSYFKDFDIVEYGILYGRPTNFLKFKIAEKPKRGVKDE